MAYQTVTVGSTSKGARVWLQATSRHGWDEGETYTATYGPGSIIIQRCGERSITRAKGGIIDLCGAKITKAAEGNRYAHVVYTSNLICITFSN